MRKYFLLCIFLYSCSSEFDLKNGDILFQDLDSSELCIAIEGVSEGYNGSNLSHIGMIVKQNNQILVIEALPPKVVLTPLKNFLNRSKDINGNPKVLVGRLKDKFKNHINKSINYCLMKIGHEYDDEFIFDNNSLYCSELIYNSFNNDTIFKAKPMIFESQFDKNIVKIWIDYYNKLDRPIPHDKLGINPGMMSISDAIEIVYIYGLPDGYESKKSENEKY